VTLRVALAALLLAILGFPASAHEVRPAYLQLRESAAGEVAVVWKTPARGEMRLALTPRLSGAGLPPAGLVTRRAAGSAIQEWHWRLPAPLRGQVLSIDGLQGTLTDALVRADFADGSTWMGRLTPRAPEVLIPERPGAFAVMQAYLALGVEHILLGVDHLAFVLALLLIVRGVRQLVLTVSAFTVAHSITLALATLGAARLPPAPVEAVIALSIVFVAAEILRERRGIGGLTARAPWAVAFAFGLLHGFGFAGALAEIGLPQGQLPLALLFFNLGVEVGQLAFVASVLFVVELARRVRLPWPRWLEGLPPYAIGSVAAFWVFQRIAVFPA